MSAVPTPSAAQALRERLHDFTAQKMAEDLLDACADLDRIEDCARVLLERGHSARNAGLMIDDAISFARSRAFSRVPET
jgi:glutaredoxin 2